MNHMNKSLVNNLFSFDLKGQPKIISKNENVRININDIGKKDDKKIHEKKERNFYPLFKKILRKNISFINKKDKSEEIAKGNESSCSILPQHNLNILDQINENIKENKTKNKTENENENKNEKYIIKNINKKCLCLRNKKRNIERIIFEEGMKLIKENLDVSKLFKNSLIVGKKYNDETINVHISGENQIYIKKILEKRIKNFRKIK